MTILYFCFVLILKNILVIVSIVRILFCVHTYKCPSGQHNMAFNYSSVPGFSAVSTGR